ncbi:hypothetical protein BC826DRAFT_1011363 [Russula brevipes]|nr:hypothetical protein BC826DRAFT_1011363 [Russula brevipes]
MSHQVIDFLDNHPSNIEFFGGIDEVERWWVERQEALERAGYMLRPRYHPGWKPSWEGTRNGQSTELRLGMDATRISDGRPLQINNLFSTEPLYSNPKNHCVHLLDPPFQTFGEFVTFFEQICEGVQFMHNNHVAHRLFIGLYFGNIMLDPSNMYPESFHPVEIIGRRHFRIPTTYEYLLIDFAMRGGDKSAPEHQDGKTFCDPFPTDVYYLGNLVRKHYIQKYHGFEFMEPLVADMVQDDPTKRPKMDEVVTRFLETKAKLSAWKLRSRITHQDEIWPLTAWRGVMHWCRTIGYVVGRKAAIPEPK